MNELQSRLARAKRLEAHGYRLKSDADDPAFLARLAEVRSADLTARLLAAGDIDPNDRQGQLDAMDRFAANPEAACLEGHRLTELENKALSEIQATEAAQKQCELEARQAAELQEIQARSAEFQARTAELNAELKAKQQRIELLEQLDLAARQRDADAGIQQLIDRGILQEWDTETLEDHRKNFVEDPEILQLTLRLPDNRIRFIGRAAF